MQKKRQWPEHSRRLLQGISNKEKKKISSELLVQIQPNQERQRAITSPLPLHYEFITGVQFLMDNYQHYQEKPASCGLLEQRQTREGTQIESRLITPIERWLFCDQNPLIGTKESICTATAFFGSVLYFLLTQDSSAESLNQHHSNYAPAIKQMWHWARKMFD